LRLPKSYASNYRFYINASIVVKKIAKNYDIIHDDFSPTSSYSFLWHNNSIATIHEIFGNNTIRRYGIAGLAPLINEKFFHRMGYKAYITPSPSTKNELKKLGINSIVIPNGVDKKLFRPNPKKRNEKKITISMISRFIHIKGHIYFIEVAKQVFSKYKDVEFILPSTGPLSPKMKELSHNLKLPICFPGFLKSEKDIVNVLQKSDIYVNTSLQEGFGISVCKAMACQIPIVAFNVLGIKDLVTPKCGFLITPKNIEELSNAILRLIKDSSLRYKLGLEARKRILKNFTIDKSVEKMLEVYNHIQ